MNSKITILVLAVLLTMCLAKPAAEHKVPLGRYRSAYEKKHRQHSEYLRALAEKYKRGRSNDEEECKDKNPYECMFMNFHAPIDDCDVVNCAFSCYAC